MTFYYVKAGSIATGDAGRTATKRTGSFATMGASACYDSIYDVLTGGVPATSPVAGDFILCSSSHAKVHSGADIIIGISDKITVLSVDDSNAENYLKGAAESVTGIYDLSLPAASLNTIYRSKGVDYHAGDDLKLAMSAGQRAILQDCEIGLTGNKGTDEINATFDGVSVSFEDVVVSFSQTTQSFDLNNSYLHWIGGSVSGAIAYLFETAGSNSRGAFLSGVDLTAVTSAVTKVMSSSSNDIATIELYKCLLSSGVVLDNTAISSAVNVNIIGRSIGFGAATDTFDYYQEKCYQGAVTQDTSVYKTATAYSSEIVTNSNNSDVSPLKFKLVEVYLDASLYTTDITFTVHLARNNGTLLTNSDVSMKVEFSDGADNALGATVDTAIAPIATATSLTDEAGGWIGLTGVEGTNHQVMSISSGPITIGTSTGNIATGQVSIEITVNGASETIYIDPDVIIS